MTRPCANDPSPGIPAARGRRAWVRILPAALALAALVPRPAPARADAPQAPVKSGVPSWWSQMAMRDLSGAPLNLQARWYVVIFMGQECPVSNESIPVLNRLAAEFSAKGFAFVGAYVDPTADLASLRAHVADYAVAFPTADDRTHRLVHFANATYTPEVAVFTASGRMLYKGRLDDRVGSNGATRPAAAHQDLRDAMVAIASGSTGPFKGSRGFGCAIPEAVTQ